MICSNVLPESVSHAQSPRDLAESPESPMDAFSEVLSGVKLRGAVYFTADFSAPWGLTVPASNVMTARMAPGADHLILYHLVLEGGPLLS